MPPSPRRARPRERRNLTTADVSKVVDLIRSWPENRVTWMLLVERVATYVGHRWTRQALEKHEAIKGAYQAAREGRRPASRAATRDPAEVVWQRRAEVLQQEVERLKQQLATYEERFVRYEYNAHARGIDPAELGRPLPGIDRGRTDV